MKSISSLHLRHLSLSIATLFIFINSMGCQSGSVSTPTDLSQKFLVALQSGDDNALRQMLVKAPQCKTFVEQSSIEKERQSSMIDRCEREAKKALERLPESYQKLIDQAKEKGIVQWSDVKFEKLIGWRMSFQQGITIADKILFEVSFHGSKYYIRIGDSLLLPDQGWTLAEAQFRFSTDL